VKFYGADHNLQIFLSGGLSQLHQTGQDIGRSSQHCTFVSEFGFIAVFSNASGSKLSDVMF